MANWIRFSVRSRVTIRALARRTMGTGAGVLWPEAILVGGAKQRGTKRVVSGLRTQKPSDQSPPNRLRHRMRAVDGAELCEDDLQAFLDSDLAAAELAVGEPPGGELDDLAVLVGEVGVAAGLLACQPLEVLEHRVQQLRTEL